MIAFYEQSVALAVRLNELEETIALINKLMDILEEIGTEEQIKKYVLSICIIYLSKDDWVSAKNYLENIKKRFDSAPRGFSRIDELLDAYDEKDDDKMKNIIKTYISYAVDNELLKMMNTIIKSDNWIRETQAAQIESSKKQVSNTADSYHMKQKIPDSTENNNNNQASSEQTIPSLTGQQVEEEGEDEFDDLK